MPDTLVAWLLGLAGLETTILIAAFGFTHQRIVGVRDDMEKRLVSLQDSMGKQIAKTEEAQRDLWEAINRHVRASMEQHERLLERLSKVPTRDDLRQDLQHMENRLIRSRSRAVT